MAMAPTLVVAMPSAGAVFNASVQPIAEFASWRSSGIQQRSSLRGISLHRCSSEHFSATAPGIGRIGDGAIDVGSVAAWCCGGICTTSTVSFRNARFGWSANDLLGLYEQRLAVRGIRIAPPPPLALGSAGEKTNLINAMARDESHSLEIGATDLLVVGPGVLGSLVARLWIKENEGTTVVGQTNTTARHEELKSFGIVPVVKDPQNEDKFPYVIFCAPPSGSSDYAAEVRAAAQRWNGEGSLLFTSSSALYDVSDNGVCDEKSAPCVPEGRGPRTDRLLNAEAEILKVGGNVVRLAVSLDFEEYTLNRGAHTFYLSKGSFEARPDQILNLIHYEDAATLSMAILKGESRGQIYMGCDNFPLARQELMDAVNKSGKFEQKFNEFTGVDGPLGKRMNNHLTRLATGWEPKYESFPSFLGVMTASASTRI